MVKTVSDAAQVLLLTDPASGVTARTQDGVPGIVQTGTPGNPNDLLMQRIPRGEQAPRVGDMVITAGIESARFTSYFPPRIPIGEVTEVDPNELDTSQQVHIRPYADLHNLDVVTGAHRAEHPLDGAQAVTPGQRTARAAAGDPGVRQRCCCS